MDPITRAARAFMAEAEVFWREGRGRALRMIAGAPERGELVKTLRLMELAPENHRPFFLSQEPFEAAEAYFDGLARKVRGDYERIREGLAADGVRLPPFTLNEPERVAGFEPSERAVLHVERASALLGDRFDGVVLALVPNQIADAGRWRESISALLAVPWSTRIRLAILDAPQGPLRPLLGEGGARFSVDPDALWAFLQEASVAAGEAAAKRPAPPGAEEARRSFEQETGRKLPSTEGGAKLRALLIDAAQHTRNGRHEAAAEAYGQARALCQAEGMAQEEAMILMGLAGLSLAMKLPERAIDCYQRAAEMGRQQGALPLACQAWLGVGGVMAMQKTYLPAARAYEAAASAAAEAKVPALRIEALRMAGTCHVLRGARDEAIEPWQQAVAEGQALEQGARKLTTFKQVAAALVDVLERFGLRPQAAYVSSLLAADQEG